MIGIWGALSGKFIVGKKIRYIDFLTYLKAKQMPGAASKLLSASCSMERVKGRSMWMEDQGRVETGRERRGWRNGQN